MTFELEKSVIADKVQAAVAYFSMGSNLGWTPIDVEFVRSDSKVSSSSLCSRSHQARAYQGDVPQD